MEEFINFDSYLITTLGEFGYYQFFIICVLCIPTCFLSSWHTMHMVFLFYTPPHYCDLSDFNDPNENLTKYESECVVKKFNWNNESEYDYTCNKWIYDQTYFDVTVITQWNLVCAKALIPRTIIALMDLASFIAFFYSFLMDRWGRKKTFLLSLTVLILGSFTSLLAQDLTLFIVLKFIGHVTCVWQTIFCWAIEFVGPSYRTLVSTVISVLFSIATVLLGVVAYFSRTWVQIGFWSSVPFLLLYLLYFFVPESPRWLLSRGKVEEAKTIMVKMAYWNNVKLDQSTFEEQIKILSSHSTETKEDKLSFLKSRNLRLKIIVIAFLGITTDQLLFVIPYSLEKLQGNFIIAFILQALIETPATLINLLILNRFGRILPLSLSLLLSSLFCFLTWPMSHTHEWGPIAFAILAKFFIIQSVAIINQLDTELYPTVNRGMCSGVRYALTSVSLLTTQYVVYTNIIWNILPLLVMGSLNLVASFVCLFLPDTCGTFLPETVEDAEKFGSVGWKSFVNNLKWFPHRANRINHSASLINN